MFAFLTTLLSLALLAEANIDGLVCSNTSYYGEVEYLEDTSSCCETRLGEPECTTKVEEACVDVTESLCEVSLFDIFHFYMLLLLQKKSVGNFVKT